MARRAEETLRIAVLNGPNLNLLGVREPELYGRETLEDIERRLRSVASEMDVTIAFAQYNGEGELIDAIHSLRTRAAGVVINAGAYTHHSIAIRDALVGAGLPFMEVHLTNIYGREPERRHSMLASAAVGLVCGLGAYGYEVSLRALVEHLRAR